MAWSQNSCCAKHDHSDYDRKEGGECSDCIDCGCADDDRCKDCVSCCAPEGSCRKKDKPNKWSTKQEGENKTMNTTIAKLFEKTADAVLVNKHYGHIIKENDVEVIKLKGKEKEILEAAKGKQAKDDAARNVVNARITA